MNLIDRCDDNWNRDVCFLKFFGIATFENVKSDMISYFTRAARSYAHVRVKPSTFEEVKDEETGRVKCMLGFLGV